jgi:predicted SPOUT superfamily RNA methylase MTH1
MGVLCVRAPGDVGLTSKSRLEIAIPVSVVSDVPHLREKTSIIGRIGRAASIYGVRKILIFQDTDRRNLRREGELVKTVLSYMETPQYLRKRLFKISPVLRFAGVLPPLRTAHHPTSRKVKVGEYRDGTAISHTRSGTMVDVGTGHHFKVENRRIPIDQRVTVKIARTKGEPLAVVVDPRKTGQYWGYEVLLSDSTLGRILKKARFDLVIATSRRGRPLTQAWDELKTRWETARTILIIFGAPTQGLYEILGHERMNLDDSVDFVVNVVPLQKVETVRTEEAVMATLSAINSLSC